MEGQTTLLITAEQVGMLSEYMTLARLFQPSLVVIEDVDLIARDRAHMHTPGEEVLLNKLLNEMDGLKPNTDILFVLTTNRPEKLEAALASRPGRIDQAIEFPLPDDAGRAKLVRLYSRSVPVPDDVAAAVVKKTERVSASFIKELMRRGDAVLPGAGGHRPAGNGRRGQRAGGDAVQRRVAQPGAARRGRAGRRGRGVGHPVLSGRAAGRFTPTGPLLTSRCQPLRIAGHRRRHLLVFRRGGGRGAQQHEATPPHPFPRGRHFPQPSRQPRLFVPLPPAGG